MANLSSPTRGMWIEIGYSPPSGLYFGSSPTRGMWIEIRQCCAIRRKSSVIPHAGDVD